MDQTEALTREQRSTLRKELAREDLSCYSVVIAARREVSAGHFDAAMAFLRTDADKVRMHSPELYALIRG